MRFSIACVSCFVAAAVGTRKPADMSDVAAIADFATSAADLFLDAAKALPSPEEARAALAAQDDKDLRAMVAAEGANMDSSAGASGSFLSARGSSSPVANIRFVEPAGGALQPAVDAQKHLEAALDALVGAVSLCICDMCRVVFCVCVCVCAGVCERFRAETCVLLSHSRAAWECMRGVCFWFYFV